MFDKLVLASNNPGKLREFAALFAPFRIEVLPQSAFAIPEAEEPHCTFLENGLAKARHAARVAQLPAVADDSGLEVDALGGAPGVYSARYAGEGSDAAANNAKLLKALTGVPPEKRRARFRGIIVFVRSAVDPHPLVGEGVWEGRIALAPRGSGGFGFDPLFAPLARTWTAAALPPHDENARRHRGAALRALVARWPR